MQALGRIPEGRFRWTRRHWACDRESIRCMSTSDTANPTRQTDGTATDEFGTNVGEALAAKFDFEPQLWAEEDMGESSRCNVGRTEQKFRIVTGGALLAIAAFAPLGRGWRIGLAVLGAAELATGAMRYCPINQALGINTCREEEF